MFRMQGSAAVLLAVFLMGPFSKPHAQSTTIEGGCDNLLNMAGRDFDERTYDATLRRYIVGRYCENGHSRQGSRSVNAAMRLLMNTSDIEATGEDIQTICQSDPSSDDAWLKAHSAATRVVEAAIESWQSCQSLAAQGVSITPQVQSRTRHFDIELRPSTSRSVGLRGIFYDPQRLICTNMAHEVLNEKTVRALTNMDESIHCERVAVADMTPSPIGYRNAHLRIQTTRGNFSLSLPASAAQELAGIQDFNEKVTLLRNHVTSVSQTSTFIPVLNSLAEISIDQYGLKVQPWPGAAPENKDCQRPEDIGRIVIHTLADSASRAYVCSRNPFGWQVVEATEGAQHARFEDEEPRYEERWPYDPFGPYWGEFGYP